LLREGFSECGVLCDGALQKKRNMSITGPESGGQKRVQRPAPSAKAAGNREVLTKQTKQSWQKKKLKKKKGEDEAAPHVRRCWGPAVKNEKKEKQDRGRPNLLSMRRGTEKVGRGSLTV